MLGRIRLVSSSAAKKDEDQTAEVDLSATSDREQGLSQNFEDPKLEDLVPGMVDAQPSVMQETVEAVQELVEEVQGEALPDEALLTEASEAESAQDFGSLPVLLTPDVDAHAAPSQETTDEFDPDPPASAEITGTSLPQDSVEEPVQMFVMEGAANEDNSHARWVMAEKLFQLVACELSFNDLVEAGLSTIMQSHGAQAGAILELDNENQSYFFRASIGGGDPEKVKAFRVPFHKGIVGHVGESRQPTLLTDLAEDQMQMRAISMSVGFEAKTCMAAPIIIGGQVFGVVELFNRLDGGFFQQRDLQQLEEGVRLLAKVLEVRFLMAELMRRTRS
jgi:GAF domain-containing protein